VIVDDSHSVWAQHRDSLVAVERYIYFPSSRASLGLRGPSLLDANRQGAGMGGVVPKPVLESCGVPLRPNMGTPDSMTLLRLPTLLYCCSL
jgi:hypothetical protein